MTPNYKPPKAGSLNDLAKSSAKYSKFNPNPKGYLKACGLLIGNNFNKKEHGIVD